MSLAQYGFQKLVLLNSAGYSRAELPLDDSVSIIAPNNTGKTSLINALQFLLILNKQHMDFGAHSVENSKRFYFPDNSAYILLEVLLPSGMAVIGCVGKGLSHDYEYFAYQGSLDLDDYRLDDGKLVAQPKLIARLFECGKSAKIYPQADLRALLYGNRQKQRADDPDLTIFPLEFTSQAATYQRILTRTLRLDKLDSKEVKNYLLEIFKNDLQDRNVDFKSEWDKSFADVNYDKSQYDAVFRNQSLISAMEDNQHSRLVLRGKLILWRPLLEKALNEWEDFNNSSSEQLRLGLRALDQEAEALENRQKTIYEDRADAKTELKGHEKVEVRYQELNIEFLLVSNVAQLQTQRKNLQDQRDQLVRSIGNAEQQQSLEAINRQIAKISKEKTDLLRQLQSINNNLYLQLQKLLPADSFDFLTRLLAKSVLSLPIDQANAIGLNDQTALRSFAALLEQRLFANRLELPGLLLDLSALEPNLIIKTAQELETEISDCEHQLLELIALLKTVETLSQQKQQQQKLEQQIAELTKDEKNYEELLSLKVGALERLSAIEGLKQKLILLEQETSALAEQKKTFPKLKKNIKLNKKNCKTNINASTRLASNDLINSHRLLF